MPGFSVILSPLLISGCRRSVRHQLPACQPMRPYQRQYSDHTDLGVTWDTPQADTLECWNVAVLHRRRAHGEHHEPVSSSGCTTADCSSCTVEDVVVGS